MNMLQGTIENLIEKSLKTLSDIYYNINNIEGRLIFPAHKKYRVSEQEARFLFTRELEKQKNLYYSVEVPTKEKYKFSSKGKKINPPTQDNSGQSGNVDVCIYAKDKKTIISLVEFKAGQPDEHSIAKDFLKLLLDESGLQNYFIHVLKNSNNKTIKNVKEKYKKVLKQLQKNKKKSNIRILIYIIKNKKLEVFDIVDTNNNLTILELI